MIKYKEAEVQAILSKFVTTKKKAKHFFVNLFSFYDGTNELDFLYIDKYGYAIELEIKCGRQDALLDEFRLKTVKHDMLANKDTRCPNRFYIACTPDVVTKDDTLPPYCGLLHILVDSKGNHRIKTIKRAILLHKEKVQLESFFQKVYYQLTKFQKKFFIEKEKELKVRLKKSKIID